MTTPEDNEEEARLGELLSDYLDHQEPGDSARAFDTWRHASREDERRTPYRAFFAGAAACAALCALVVGSFVAITTYSHRLPDAESEVTPMAHPAQTETYGETPRGWAFIPSKGLKCEVGVSHAESYEGETSSILRADDQDEDHFCALSQSITPTKYEGKRVRFSAWVKSEEVTHHAGLWMRVDGEAGRVLAFDNMGDRPIRGTRDWQRYAVVLDIPKGSSHIVYGALLAGSGKIFWDEAHLEVVEDSTPTTSIVRDEPHNTSFEQ